MPFMGAAAERADGDPPPAVCQALSTQRFGQWEVALNFIIQISIMRRDWFAEIDRMVEWLRGEGMPKPV
ncbi:hypothetical protein N7462_006639 [Penicillium macrosclerotiorum]|uniref:uncharacterized protein n=1 Tax=Penicillium macrosclerotiorum TaxID=303699 RepID=UPI0025495E4A|nr:uncharacterized protein N7462_006639 [Penicillium macrosclerotiorum]KAJ5683474.1 hypothetical protein N7462_006639 [Penicillium macrosclerotiorum]